MASALAARAVMSRGPGCPRTRMLMTLMGMGRAQGGPGGAGLLPQAHDQSEDRPPTPAHDHPEDPAPTPEDHEVATSTTTDNPSMDNGAR